MWGPTCDGLDCVLPSVLLPDLSPGDWLYFHNMGAYTLAAGSTFNGMPRPRVHYVMEEQLWLRLKQLGKEEEEVEKEEEMERGEKMKCCDDKIEVRKVIEDETYEGIPAGRLHSIQQGVHDANAEHLQRDILKGPSIITRLGQIFTQ